MLTFLNTVAIVVLSICVVLLFYAATSRKRDNVMLFRSNRELKDRLEVLEFRIKDVPRRKVKSL